MEIVQFYETTVADRTKGHSFSFLVIPNRSLTVAVQNADPTALDGLATQLGLQPLQPVRPSLLPQAIMGMLLADEAENVQQLQAQAVLSQFLQSTKPSDDLMQFAEQIAFTDLIPFEGSFSLVSLAGKAASLASSPVGLGAFIGVIAGGTTPLLLVTVPAGIILCGTATAFAKVVNERKDDILNKLLGVRTKKVPKATKE